MEPLKSVQYGAVYNRLLRQNALVRWTHIVLGALAAVCYESQNSPSHYAFWRSTEWVMIAIRAVPIWPYALSCVAVWRRTTPNWARPWIFCFSLLVITILVCLWYLTELSRQSGFIANLTITMFQSAAYYYLAQWTYEDSVDQF